MASRAASSSPEMVVTYLGYVEDPSDLTTYTFATDVSAGVPLVVAVATRAAASGLSGVTIGGTAATLLVTHYFGLSEAGLYYATTPSASPNVVVTRSTAAVRCAIGLYGLSREPVVAGTTTIDGALPGTLAAGQAIAVQSGGNSSVTFSPSSIAEDRDVTYEVGSYGLAHGPHVGGTVYAIPSTSASASTAVFVSLT